MSDNLKSIFGGIAAIPIVLLMTIGIGLASGMNPHFLLFSVLITNIIGIIFNRDSTDFYNISPSLAVFMFVAQGTIGIDSGYLQTFVFFAIPAIVFAVLSWLPINYPLIPNRVIAIFTFGVGLILIIKQLPYAFFYDLPEHDFAFNEEQKSIIASSTFRNWMQLSLALFIPIVAVIGLRYRKGKVALLIATLVSLGIGYLLGFDTTTQGIASLEFTYSFQLNWTYSSELLISTVESGITITVVMLISFWSDYSILNYDEVENKVAIKKSLRTVGMGNLLGGLFGVMPTNVALAESLSVKAYGGNKWISKIPILVVLLVIALVGVPDFNIPVFVFAGVLIYIGILMIIKSWEIHKELHPIDYIFTIALGSVIIYTDFTAGFFLSMVYAVIYHLIIKQKKKYKESSSLDREP